MTRLNPENQIDRVIAFWQTEDLLRGHQFDIERLLDSRQFTSEEDRDHSTDWLSEFKNKMQQEDVLAVGHTSDSKEIIVPLQVRHKELLNTNETYQKVFDQIAPAIKRYNTAKQLPVSEVEVMFELLYAFYLKKLANEPMSKEVEHLGTQSGELLNQLIYA